MHQPVTYIDPTTGQPMQYVDPNHHYPQPVPAADGGPPASLYVKNLPAEATKLTLYEIFAPFGAIRSVKVLVDETGKCKGVGFVNYSHFSDAQNAIAGVNNTRPQQCEMPLVVTLQQQRNK